MNLIDYVMAIPFAIAITSLFSGILMIIGYIASEATGNKDILLNIVHILNNHYKRFLFFLFVISYTIAIVFLYGIFNY